ncbi:hypothetical protein TNCT_283501, partial [Trichonephila clavata]
MSSSIQDGICPNKYIIGNPQWLNGKEYWNSDFSKLDQDERKKEIENIINSIKRQGKDIDCSSLSSSQKSKIDTRILNLLCGRICKFPSGSGNKGCAYIEYNSVEGEIFNALNSSDGSVIAEIISNVLKEKQVKTDITLLHVHMDGEYIPTGGICTNCDYKIEKYHRTPSLTFSLCSRNDKHCYNRNDKGGFNIRVTKNHSLENSLYISVSDKLPEHKPGENQA